MNLFDNRNELHDKVKQLQQKCEALEHENVLHKSKEGHKNELVRNLANKNKNLKKVNKDLESKLNKVCDSELKQ